MIQEFEYWVENNVQDQTGKTVVITGGNSGIGYYTALGLAKVGANVVIAGRDQLRVDTAISTILKEDISGTVSGAIIDLSSLDSVRLFAKDFQKNNDHLDILINNAGVMMPPESKTQEGYELQFGVNFVGHFLLTYLLNENLKKAPNSRVVSVSSIAHRGSTIDFDNLRLEKPYNPKREYYQSKLANIVFALELAKRYEERNNSILSVACHPGFTKTNLQQHVSPEILAKMNFMDTWQGSLPLLMAATKVDAQSGEYYGPDGEGEFQGFPSLGVIDDSALIDGLGEKLWEVGMMSV